MHCFSSVSGVFCFHYVVKEFFVLFFFSRLKTGVLGASAEDLQSGRADCCLLWGLIIGRALNLIMLTDWSSGVRSSYVKGKYLWLSRFGVTVSVVKVAVEGEERVGFGLDGWKGFCGSGNYSIF